jgi:2-dehydropantoate 2-reductase
MRTLVVGAGAVGGYFGGRLLEINRDVTFLVRSRRAAQLSQSGLRIRSSAGDLTIPHPPLVQSPDLHTTYDLVLLSSKAYDLENAIASFAPAVGPHTLILPLLNGMAHLDTLDRKFGPDRVLGGMCLIASTLKDGGEIVHLNDRHAIAFGERDGALSERVLGIDRWMEGARFEHKASPNIVGAMWEKWVFLATLAGGTCLFRASVGNIAAAPGGSDFMLRLLEDCREIAVRAGYPPRDEFLSATRPALIAHNSTLTASMLRDIEAGGPIEADHIVGDLLARGDSALLRIVYSALKAYEARRTSAPIT